ncbi:MAG TPA: hypothetical protein VK659_10240 [Asanoa sp.]|nr:hypothetical protein [Asanoa sp.]
MPGKRYPQGGLATPFPTDDDDQAPAADPAPAGDDDDLGDQEQETPETRRAQRRPTTRPAAPARRSGGGSGGRGGRSWSPPSITAPPSVQDGAGFVLGALFWVWVALPFIKSGGKPAAVRDVLRAKFLNKAPDGSWLP